MTCSDVLRNSMKKKGAILALVVGMTGVCVAPAMAAVYGFESGTEGWQALDWDPGVTAVVQSTAWAYGGSTNSLKLFCDFTNAVRKGWAGVTFDAQNLLNTTITMRVYCPSGSCGASPVYYATQLRLWVRNAAYQYQETTWDAFKIPVGISTQYVTHKVTNSATFSATNVTEFGLQVYWQGIGWYKGPLYIDHAGYGPVYQLPAPFSAPTNQQYSFDATDEGFEAQTYHNSMACTNRYRLASPPANTTACLAVDVHLIEGHTNYAKGEVFVDMENHFPKKSLVPANLKGQPVTAWVYCPAGSQGPSSKPNTLQVFCKDAGWKSFYGLTVNVAEGQWMPVTMIADTNAPTAWMDPGFDPTQIRVLGVKFAASDGSGATYDGKIYVDGVSFTPIPLTIETNDLRYGFEPNKEGWEPLVYEGMTGIVSVAQSTNVAGEGTHSLRMNVKVNNTSTNRSKGVARVDMLWFPPPSVRAPFDLDGKTIRAFLYCPEGSESTKPALPNEAKIYVKSGTNYLAENGAASIIRNGTWIRLSLTPSTNEPPGGYMKEGFDPKEIVELGVEINMGTYTGALYLDAVNFEAVTPPMPPTQHGYDFEGEYQKQWWKWDAAPGGWEAYAWTNTTYATNQGYNGSVALAAPAHFADTSAPYSERKGVFTIMYNPPLNLSTKTHRIFQAKLRFEPPVEGSQAFDSSLNVYDKITDQWYAKAFKTGGSGWNILEFDLDDPDEYDQGLPPIPMDPSRIGALTVQVFGNQAWTGTVYLDDVVIGGVECGTNYNLLTSDFVTASNRNFMLNGKRYYFAGANAEYMFSVYDSVCEELFNDATNLHLNLVRTWAFHEGQEYSFQPKRGVWNELAFEHLDRIVAMAGHHGIRLLLGLCDNWAHNGGMFQYMNWVLQEHPESMDTNCTSGSVQFHDQFYTNQYCRQWYRDFVTVLMNRTNTITGRIYKNDPTIFGWEIVNEPRCESDFSGRTIHEWLNTMSDWVRSVDTNHALAGGEEGGYVKTYDQADAVPWESYPDNYYHYAVHGVGPDYCTEVGCGRGHGVDFLSDHSSQSRQVFWQGGTVTNRGEIQSEWRPGNSNLNFTTCRIYIDQKEYNVWRTNFNDCDQRIEWINDHVFDAHQNIRKPLILEEFGIHSVGWIYNGSFGQVQFKRQPAFNAAQRAQIFDMYFNHVEKTDMAGSFYWNMGYKGMWEDPFYRCETVGDWVCADIGSSATSITASAAHVLEGSNALQMSYYVPDVDHNKAIFMINTNDQWIVREINGAAKGINRVKFFWNIYNPGPVEINVALALRGTTNWTWAESPMQKLTTGWNRIMFDLSAEYWACAAGSWKPNWSLIDIKDDRNKNLLEDVKQADLCFYNLPNGHGSVFVDNITIVRDDGFVVYVDDPAAPYIRAHADRMAAKSAGHTGNHAPVASSSSTSVTAYAATPLTLSAADSDGDPLAYIITSRPTNGWVVGTPPNLTYKPRVSDTVGDCFTFKVTDGMVDSAEATVFITILGTNRYTLHLAYTNDTDLFPRAVAEQTNYTGAACGWMITRYLRGDSFTNDQQDIYDETTHDPAHRSEIVPSSCAAWMNNNAGSGYYFSSRTFTTLDSALKETVYWMDYLPPGGKKTPVYIVCETNWYYKVVRGFQTDVKPYGGGYSSPYGSYTVYGVWLNDPILKGLGYDVYASAEEMSSIYLPSLSDGRYWLVAEPPRDPAQRKAAQKKVDRTKVKVAKSAPNPALAKAIRSKLAPAVDNSVKLVRTSGSAIPLTPPDYSKLKLGGSGSGSNLDLTNAIPPALRTDAGFMNAFNQGPYVQYYEVNPGTPQAYYLAAGAVRGPASTLFVMKLATNGSFQQTTWSGQSSFYPPVSQDAAVWAARRQIANSNATLVSARMVYPAPQALSPFLPTWEVKLLSGGLTVTARVSQATSLAGDADGDGMSDGQEIYAGFNPDRMDSVFDIDVKSLTGGAAGKVVVSWLSLTNKTYGIHRTTSLAQPFSPIAQHLAGTPPVNSYTDQPPASAVYYRVTVE